VSFLRRDYSPGDVLLVHLSDNSTVKGSFVREGRTFLRLARHSIEGNGVLVASAAESVLVPRALVKLIEVVGR
jgi:hypothetical protein